MNREPGYYWVKYEDEWYIYKYHGIGAYPWELSKNDSDFDEIDERMIKHQGIISKLSSDNLKDRNQKFNHG